MSPFNEEGKYYDEFMDGDNYGGGDDDGRDFDDVTEEGQGFNDDEPVASTWSGVTPPKLSEFDTIADYEAAQDRYKRQQALTPWEDDPHGAARKEALDYLQECERGRADAECRGDSQAVRDWDERARMTAKDLNALPESPEIAWKREYEAGTLGDAVAVLYKPELVGDPAFESPRMQNDAAILVAKANREAAKTGIVLPMENGERGNPVACKPGNMLGFKLDKDQLQDFQASVYYSGGESSPDAIFRRSWAWIRMMGLESHGIQPATPRDGGERKKAGGGQPENRSISRAPDPISPTGESSVSFTKDPEKMTQREYEQWRRSGGS